MCIRDRHWYLPSTRGGTSADMLVLGRYQGCDRRGAVTAAPSPMRLRSSVCPDSTAVAEEHRDTACPLRQRP
eukprot:957177-Rhodomonas_salina.2